MPYLNWKDAELTALTQQVTHAGAGEGGRGGGRDDGRDERMLLALGLAPAARTELLGRLREVLDAPLGDGPAAELRVDLPRNWIVFWKLRDGESRLLIAHPQAEEWVATAALSVDHAHAFLDRLAGLQAGDSLSLGQLAPVDRVSNVEIVVALSAPSTLSARPPEPGAPA